MSNEVKRSACPYLMNVIILLVIPIAIHTVGIYIVVEMGIVLGWSLVIAPFIFWVVYAHTCFNPSTFTIYEITCKKCGKKFSSRISIMSDLKYRFHKFLGLH